jgi:hypothetical protein
VLHVKNFCCCDACFATVMDSYDYGAALEQVRGHAMCAAFSDRVQGQIGCRGKSTGQMLMCASIMWALVVVEVMASALRLSWTAMTMEQRLSRCVDTGIPYVCCIRKMSAVGTGCFATVMDSYDYGAALEQVHGHSM